MKGKGKANDGMLLSAYLDGEIAAREKEKLEQRLRASPQLRDDLAQLRTTRAMIRSLPRKKAPRNFVLTPEMVKARRPAWLPLFGLTSAASAIVALVLLFIQFVPGMLMNSMPRLAGDTAAEVAMFAEEAVQESPQEEGEPEIIYWGGPPDPSTVVMGKGGGAPDEGFSLPSGPVYQAQPEALAQPAEMEGMVPEQPMEQPAVEVTRIVEEAVPGAELAAPEAESEPAEESQLSQQSDSTNADEGSGPILGIRPTEEGGQVVSVPESTEALRRGASERELPVLTILLLAFSLVSGLITFVIWRSRR